MQRCRTPKVLCRKHITIVRSEKMTCTCPYCKSACSFSAEYLDSKLECPTCGRHFLLSLSTHPTPRQLFLDIETTGFRPSNGELTTIVWFGDGAWGHWVNDGMSPASLIAAWNNSLELVTFNGRAFDEPWLVDTLGFPKHSNHIDLREETGALGLEGSLKEITQRLGIPRPQELDLMEGRHAIKLWKSSRKGNRCSLCNLLYYNAWDVVLTYRLYCHIRAIPHDPIEDTIPFGHNAHALRPFVGGSGVESPTARVAPSSEGIPLNQLWRDRRASPLTRLEGALVCFTGDLKRCEREEAEALVSSLGGIVKHSVVQRLDFLVVGDTGEYGKTGKIAKAEEYINRGAHLRIIGEDEFFELVRRTKEGRNVGPNLRSTMHQLSQTFSARLSISNSQPPGTPS